MPDDAPVMAAVPRALLSTIVSFLMEARRNGSLEWSLTLHYCHPREKKRKSLLTEHSARPARRFIRIIRDNGCCFTRICVSSRAPCRLIGHYVLSDAQFNGSSRRK